MSRILRFWPTDGSFCSLATSEIIDQQSTYIITWTYVCNWSNADMVQPQPTIMSRIPRSRNFQIRLLKSSVASRPELTSCNSRMLGSFPLGLDFPNVRFGKMVKGTFSHHNCHTRVLASVPLLALKASELSEVLNIMLLKQARSMEYLVSLEHTYNLMMSRVIPN